MRGREKSEHTLFPCSVVYLSCSLWISLNLSQCLLFYTNYNSQLELRGNTIHNLLVLSFSCLSLSPFSFGSGDSSLVFFTLKAYLRHVLGMFQAMSQACREMT